MGIGTALKLILFNTPHAILIGFKNLLKSTLNHDCCVLRFKTSDPLKKVRMHSIQIAKRNRFCHYHLWRKILDNLEFCSKERRSGQTS